MSLSLCLLLLFASPAVFSSPAAPRPSDAREVSKQHTVTRMGGSGQDTVRALESDVHGNIFLVADTTSPDLSVTSGAAQPTPGQSPIMRTPDGGRTWDLLAPLPGDEPQLVCPHPVLADVLFAGGSKGIYKSTDRGKSWRRVQALPPTSNRVGGLAIDPANPSRVYATAVGDLFFASADGGETWSTPSSSYRGGAVPVQVDPHGSGALLALAQLSVDGGRTWTSLRVPRNFPSASAFDPHHPGWIYLGISAGVAGTLFVSRDLGLNWTELTAPPDTFSAIENLLIDPEIPNVIYALALRGLFISADGGHSWRENRRDIYSKVRMAHLPRACGEGAGIFAVTHGGAFWASPDNGTTTWRIIPLEHVLDVAAGAGCSVYVVNAVTSPDVYISKTAPDGKLLWATYLGGLGVDTAVAAAVDGEGNLYVAGVTTSSNFPGVNHEVGEDRSDIFVIKFDANGRRLYSTVLGGSGVESAAGLAVDARGQAHLAGYSDSPDFPVTPGALRTPGESGAVAIQLDSEGNVLYAARFGEQLRPAAIALSSSGEALLTGSRFLVRLNESGSALTYEDYRSPWAGGTALATDSEGNVYIAGPTGPLELPVTSGAYRSPVRAGTCPVFSVQLARSNTDTFLAKLRSPDFALEYAALLGGDCWSEPQAIRVAPDGSVTAAILTQSVRFPVVRALAMPRACGSTGSGVIARLSPDGRTLQWATYLPSCGVPQIAPALNGALYVFLAGPGPSGGTVVHMPPPAAAVAVERLDVAFAFASFGIPPGALVGISGSNLGPPDDLDLGLNAASQLPVELGGTRVLFDGIEAPLLHVSSSRIVCVAPNHLTGQTVLQVISHAGPSDEVTVPVRASAPHPLTWAFPEAPRGMRGDGIVRNEDGTLNSHENPAAAGSTVTVYVTGLGLGDPAPEPGSIAASLFVPPVHPLYYFWGDTATPVTDVRALPGFVSALLELPIAVPDIPALLTMGLQLRLGPANTGPPNGYFWPDLPDYSNAIVVYVRRRR